MNTPFSTGGRTALAIVGALVCDAAAAQESAAAPLPDSLGLSTNLLEVTVNLALVLAAILVLAWVFKRAQGFNQPAAGQLKVTATLPLGPKERILLVEIGTEQIVVGASSAGLNTLHVLDTPLPQQPRDDESFREKLVRSLKGQPA